MKAVVTLKLLKIVEGESKKGKKWAYLMVQDEDFTNYNLFLESLKDKDLYKDQVDKEIEIPISITKMFNQQTKTFETVIKVQDYDKI